MRKILSSLVLAGCLTSCASAISAETSVLSALEPEAVQSFASRLQLDAGLRVGPFQLSNGLPVWHYKRALGSPDGVFLLIRTGSRHEDPARNGIAHLVEHYLFVGSRLHAERELRDLSDAIGGDHNASTGQDKTLFYLVSAPGTVEKAISWMAEVVLMPAFAQDQLENTKAIVKREGGFRAPTYRLMDALGVGDVSREQLFSTLFPATGMDLQPIGQPESIDAITIEDAVEFHRINYRPDNAVLVVLSSESTARVRRMVEKSFDVWVTPRTPLPNTPVAIAERNVSIRQRGISSSDRVTLWTGSVLTTANLNAATMSVLEAVLERRLFDRLRSREGLVYQVDAWIEWTRDLAILHIYTYGHSTQASRLRSALRDELQRIRDTPVDESEIQRARYRVETKRARRLESTLEAGTDLTLLIHRELDARSFEVRPSLQSVSASDVQMLARRVLDPRAMFEARAEPVTSAAGFAVVLVLGAGGLGSIWLHIRHLRSRGTRCLHSYKPSRRRSGFP